MKKRGLLFAVATALATACLPASEPWAQTEEKEQPAQPTPKIVGPCTPDIQNFCKGVKRGGGAIMRCLKEHEDELSEPCKDFRAKAHIRRGARESSVSEPQEKKVGGAVESASAPQEKKVGDAVENMSAPQEKKESGAVEGVSAPQGAGDWKQSCEDEISNFCMDVLGGKEHKLKCLNENAAISNFCMDVLGGREHKLK